MCTSDTSDWRLRASKYAFAYLLISLFLAFFGAVYEVFSHEVYSFSMIYAFAFPLAGGTLPFAFFSLAKRNLMPGRLSLNLHNSAIATLAVGSLLRGALEIYGTDNVLLMAYPIVGAVLAVAGFAVYFAELWRTRKSNAMTS